MTNVVLGMGLYYADLVLVDELLEEPLVRDPLDNEEGELAAIRQMLVNLQKTSHMASVVAALRQGTASQETQREYMRALLEARGRRSDQ